jgi:hypothetical protein
MPTPLAHADYKKLDLEIGWRLPLAKHLEDSLLGILILYIGEPCGRSNQLIACFMFFSSFGNGLTDHSALLYSLGDRCWAPGERGILSDLTSVLGQESG